METQSSITSVSHTPGPWESGAIDPHDIYAASGYVARAYATTAGPGASIANARLIAAAPELLELVNFVLACEGNDYAVDDQWVARAEAAIAKAEGVEP